MMKLTGSYAARSEFFYCESCDEGKPHWQEQNISS
jgi:hypothetical protein